MEDRQSISINNLKHPPKTKTVQTHTGERLTENLKYKEENTIKTQQTYKESQ